MMKGEFEGSIGISVSDQCYKKIEYVYMNSDFFENKAQLYHFYRTYDMAGIERMYKSIRSQKELEEMCTFKSSAHTIIISELRSEFVTCLQHTGELPTMAEVKKWFDEHYPKHYDIAEAFVEEMLLAGGTN